MKSAKRVKNNNKLETRLTAPEKDAVADASDDHVLFADVLTY